MRHRVGKDVIAVAGLIVLVIGGCSDDGDDPGPGDQVGYKVTGHVTLVATLTDEINVPQGTQPVEDADGVVVHLVGAGGAVVASTGTVAGDYTFQGVVPGTYHTEAEVVTGSAVASQPVTVTDHDTAVVQALVLAATAGLATYPNPGVDEGIGIEFTAQAAQTFLVEVRALDGELVWSYAAPIPAGYYHVHWSGEETHKHYAPEGSYWIVVHLDGAILRSLVFWPGVEEIPSEGHCGHIVALGFLLTQGEETVVSGWRTALAGQLTAGVGDWGEDIRMGFLDADSTFFAIADTCAQNHLSWTIADTTLLTVQLAGDAGWGFRLSGRRPGQTELTLHGWHEDHIHFNTPPIRVVVE